MMDTVQVRAIAGHYTAAAQVVAGYTAIAPAAGATGEGYTAEGESIAAAVGSINQTFTDFEFALSGAGGGLVASAGVYEQVDADGGAAISTAGPSEPDPPEPTGTA